ncbi:MAG: hypothetical protein F4Y04_06530 [Chloroflexi bacterium]|nr:hypothetical protein [Chloroflexota bacterium]
MTGTEMAQALASTLQAILHDPNRRFDERHHALLAWSRADRELDPEAVIRRLLELKDPDSAGLGFDVLRLVGASALPVSTVADALLAHLGFTATPDEAWESAKVRYVPDNLFQDLDVVILGSLLDRLADGARKLKHGNARDPKPDLADIVRRLIVRILSSGDTVEPARLWSWIGWIDEHLGYSVRDREKLAAILRDNHPLRAAVLEHVLLEPCDDNTWANAFRLAEVEPVLHPAADQLAGLLRALRARAGDGPIDPETYRHLLRLGCTSEGLPPDLHETALEVACGDSALLSALDQESNPSAPKDAIKPQGNQPELESEPQQILHSIRDDVAAQAEEIAAGAINVLEAPACVYLGREPILVRQNAPGGEPSTQDRMREFLGHDLAEQVMDGFVAALGRDDLPSATLVADLHSQGQRWPAEAVMICGVEEMLRRGQPISEVDRDILAAVYMAFQQLPSTSRPDVIDIGRPLEEILFKSDADWEVHFRTRIEPQLATNPDHVAGIYRLTADPDLASVASRLSIDWLRRFPELCLSTQKKLLACALDCSEEDEVRALTLQRQSADHHDREIELLWLSADFAVDFECRRATLLEVAAREPEFIWFIRDSVLPDSCSDAFPEVAVYASEFLWLTRARSSLDSRPHSDPDRGKRLARCSLLQLAFIADVFGQSWPNEPTHADVATIGNQNPWDASELIRRAIYMIAGMPSPDATSALQCLIEGHASSYIDTARHALALQRRVRRDSQYSPPTIAELRAVMNEALPEKVDDMRAWFADRIEEFRERIQGGDTNMREAYWSDTGKPRKEEFCRDRLVEHVSGPLPESIRFGPEQRMPDRKRADIAILRNAVKLPVEIKGQWEKNVWNAANEQLGDRYAVDWQAKGCGVYIVLWFGEVPCKNLPNHPDGLPRPRTPEELERMLEDRLPEARRPFTDIFVIDLSRPVGAV